MGDKAWFFSFGFEQYKDSLFKKHTSLCSLHKLISLRAIGEGRENIYRGHKKNFDLKKLQKNY